MTWVCSIVACRIRENAVTILFCWSSEISMRSFSMDELCDWSQGLLENSFEKSAICGFYSGKLRFNLIA